MRLNSPLYLKYIRLNQYLIYWPFKFVTFGLKRHTTVLLEPSDLRDDTKYVVAANHQQRVDPFIMSGQLPLWAWHKLSPFRYFIYNRLFFTPIAHWLFLAFGCFPTKPSDRAPHGLPFAQFVLEQGQTPVIYPEGKRASKGSPARPGIAQLAALPNVEIIPIHIEWRSGRLFPTYKMTIGRPIKGASLSADEIMQMIYDLPL